MSNALNSITKKAELRDIIPPPHFAFEPELWHWLFFCALGCLLLIWYCWSPRPKGWRKAFVRAENELKTLENSIVQDTQALYFSELPKILTRLISVCEKLEAQALTKNEWTELSQKPGSAHLQSIIPLLNEIQDARYSVPEKNQDLLQKSKAITRAFLASYKLHMQIQEKRKS